MRRCRIDVCGLLACAVVCCLLACDSYHDELLAPPKGCGDGRLAPGELCDPAIAAGEEGACPTSCSADDPCMPQTLMGSDCRVRCVAQPITAFVDADGCCPQGASVADDRDCASCGDGQIGVGETCDPPETCPKKKDCTTNDICARAVFSGAATRCTAACEMQPISECVDGDGCCPASCSASADHDCPSACGDGVLDATAGETCDPSAPDAGCLVAADCDDSEPCTRDALEGSAAHCDVRCSHTKIVLAAAGDGCCPKGLTAMQDPDCETGTTASGVSGSEDGPEASGGSDGTGARGDPDDGDGADGDGDGVSGGGMSGDDMSSGGVAGRGGADDGVPMSPPADPLGADEMQCRDVLTSADPPADEACSRCICERCVDDMLDCYVRGDSNRNQRCSAIMQCKQREGCTGEDCYCGSSPGCLVPRGPCVDPIRDAPGVGVSLTLCTLDPTCVNYLSTRYTECLERSCLGACRR